MKLDLNDAFVFIGLVGIGGGVAYEFTPAAACIIVGALLFFLGAWKA